MARVPAASSHKGWQVTGELRPSAAGALLVGAADVEAGDGALSGKFPATVIVIDDYDATSEALSAHIDTLRQLRDHGKDAHGRLTCLAAAIAV